MDEVTIKRADLINLMAVMSSQSAVEGEVFVYSWMAAWAALIGDDPKAALALYKQITAIVQQIKDAQ